MGGESGVGVVGLGERIEIGKFAIRFVYIGVAFFIPCRMENDLVSLLALADEACVYKTQARTPIQHRETAALQAKIQRRYLPPVNPYHTPLPVLGAIIRILTLNDATIRVGITKNGYPLRCRLV